MIMSSAFRFLPAEKSWSLEGIYYGSVSQQLCFPVCLVLESKGIYWRRNSVLTRTCTTSVEDPESLGASTSGERSFGALLTLFGGFSKRNQSASQNRPGTLSIFCGAQFHEVMNV
ncbi:hypothetical protein D9757_006833 [Collybiopsis confluens]|uniref:Uncharacterized protein n=1 Tax=Collybiopsis confluens TaxID=2823264 RepID=A0A8H5HQA8_9AGAR|nr:hypothetical protein D9757_006833 [Collybiopsis confluens]